MKKLGLILLLVFLLQGCAAQTNSNLVDRTLETVTKETYNYYLYYPEDYETEKEKDFPLLLFLHGGGESGGALDELKTNGPPKLLAEGKQFPFLVLAPQHPHSKMWWNTRAVVQLLDSVVVQNRVDSNRIYLTGLSRGGGAAWELVVQYPEKFAALAVVCGMTPVPYASWVDKNLPIWVFHGEEDESIPISESEAMVERLKSMGHDVRFTRYPGVGHNSWEQAYSTEELYQWLAMQSRGN